jgi:sterol desaturase/sphingolipid hydroxylase (fatty acid hydroxylase superfamily)
MRRTSPKDVKTDFTHDNRKEGETQMNIESLSHAVNLTLSTLKHSPELLLFFVLFACLARELRKPWRAFSRRSLGRSYSSNLATFLFNDTVLSLLSLPSLFYVAQNFSGHGLLSGMPDGLAKALAAFVLLDLMMYAWHVANHRCEMLWRFHKVHHSDTTLNVTTGLRFHVGELFLTVLLKAGFIVLVGVPVELAMLNEVILSCFVLFHHTNSSLRGERALGLLLELFPMLILINSKNYNLCDTEHECHFGTFE